MDADRHLTPSKFLERAKRRGPRHETMQKEFMEFLRGRPAIDLAKKITSRHVEAEYPIVRNGQTISFVDAIEIIHINFKPAVVTLFEIKPVIDDLYGITRQCKAQLQLARTFIPGDVHVLQIVVPHTDAGLLDLRAEWSNVWAWGIEFSECDA